MGMTLPVIVDRHRFEARTVATDTVKVDVNVGMDKPISYFSAVHTVTFPVAEGSRPGEFELLIGFDSKASGSG